MKWLAAFLVLMFTKGHHAQRAPLRHRLAGFVFRRFPGQITCAEFEQFLMDYHEGGLPEAQRVLFERHLTLCSECRASYRGYCTSIELGQRLFADAKAPLPDEVPDHLVQAVVHTMRTGGRNPG